MFYDLWSACLSNAPNEPSPPPFSHWTEWCSREDFPSPPKTRHTARQPTNTPGAVSGRAGKRQSHASSPVPCPSPDPSIHFAASWAPVQIAVPIVVGVFLIVVVSILTVLYCRARSSDASYEVPSVRGPRRLFGLLPDVGRVRRRQRAKQWSIDGVGPLHGGRNVRHHVRFASEVSIGSVESKSSAKRDWSIPLPWKAKPIPVKKTQRKASFQIDDEGLELELDGPRHSEERRQGQEQEQDPESAVLLAPPHLTPFELTGRSSPQLNHTPGPPGISVRIPFRSCSKNSH
jgi:hypothetical protein